MSVMRGSLLAAVVAVFVIEASPQPAHAQGPDFGLGVSLGGPTGLSAHLVFPWGDEVQVLAGYDHVSDFPGYGLSVRYMLDVAGIRWMYTGAGVRALVAFSPSSQSGTDETHLGVAGAVGVRVPIGQRFSLSVELVLGFDIASDPTDGGGWTKIALRGLYRWDGIPWLQ